MISKEVNFTVREMTADNIEAAIRVLQQSWLDTYVNKEYGVTHKWIEERNRMQSTPDKIEARRKWFEGGKQVGWVAEDKEGNIIGMATPRLDESGAQRLTTLYVDKEWHGKGVGAALMQQIINFFNPKKPIVLGVVTYNERAKAFYRKWGFVEVPNSERLFADKMPEIEMIRKPIK